MRTDGRTERQRQTDRRTGMTKLIAAFLHVAHTPIKNLNTHILNVIRTRDHQFHSPKTCTIQGTRVLLCYPAVITYMSLVCQMVLLTFRRLMSYIYIYMEHPFLMFLDHTQRRSTVGRTPLDE